MLAQLIGLNEILRMEFPSFGASQKIAFDIMGLKLRSYFPQIQADIAKFGDILGIPAILHKSVLLPFHLFLDR